MSVELQIFQLLRGRYIQHQEHYNLAPMEATTPGDLQGTNWDPSLPKEWDWASQLLFLSNYIPPQPHPPKQYICPLETPTYRAASRLIVVANDVEPNRGPPPCPLHLLTLNVGGPHLSRKRRGQLLQGTTASEPMVISLQEVRFRTGTAHMAYTARACPKYLLLFFGDVSLDVIFLIHSAL